MDKLLDDSFHLLKQIAVTLVATLGLSACTTPEEVELEELKVEYDWDELLEASVKAMPQGSVSYIPGWPMVQTLPKPPDNLHLIALSLPPDQSVASELLSRNLSRPIPYEGGIYGTRGYSKVFVAPTTQIHNYSRLYWVMVKVLSEKYGCFMVAKQYHWGTTRVWCRDKRQVVFWQSKNRNWIQFATRQYDKDGFEIAVKRRKIFRVSSDPVI